MKKLNLILLLVLIAAANTFAQTEVYDSTLNLKGVIKGTFNREGVSYVVVEFNNIKEGTWGVYGIEYEKNPVEAKEVIEKGIYLPFKYGVQLIDYFPEMKDWDYVTTTDIKKHIKE